MAAIGSRLRFLAGLPRHLRSSLTADEARLVLGARLSARGEALVALLRHGVYGHPASPYLPLLRRAGCELGDVAAMTAADGVEATLERLLAAGVRVPYETFKGRGAAPGAPPPHSFDNPHLAGVYAGVTGGSGGASTRVTIDLDHYAAQAPHELLATAAHGLLGAPAAAWLAAMPSPACLGVMLRRAPFARPLDRWFTPVSERDLAAPLRSRAASRAIHAVAALCGRPLPRPELVPLTGARRVATWLRGAADRDGAAVLITHVSCAVRVALAARDAGLDLGGVVMWAGSEPPTPAKVRHVEAAGARFVPGYWMIEAGFLGQGCGAPLDETDVHLFTDAFAVVGGDGEAAGHGTRAFHLTTLLPTAPKLMINVEIDDLGTIERRACGCPLGEVGLDVHLRQIHSQRKLTGEGMTVPAADVLQVLEEVLPARFGGTPLDFQLVEEEDGRGFTVLTVVASPRLGPLDEAAVRAAFLGALRDGAPGQRHAGRTWSDAGSVRVRRAEPAATPQGKLPSLVVSRPGACRGVTGRDGSAG